MDFWKKIFFWKWLWVEFLLYSKVFFKPKTKKNQIIIWLWREKEEKMAFFGKFCFQEPRNLRYPFFSKNTLKNSQAPVECFFAVFLA